MATVKEEAEEVREGQPTLAFGSGLGGALRPRGDPQHSPSMQGRAPLPQLQGPSTEFQSFSAGILSKAIAAARVQAATTATAAARAEVQRQVAVEDSVREKIEEVSVREAETRAKLEKLDGERQQVAASTSSQAHPSGGLGMPQQQLTSAQRMKALRQLEVSVVRLEMARDPNEMPRNSHSPVPCVRRLPAELAPRNTVAGPHGDRLRRWMPLTRSLRLVREATLPAHLSARIRAPLPRGRAGLTWALCRMTSWPMSWAC